MGMAEQLLFGAAAGMAETGLIPFASTYSVFATRRAYDFICLDIAEPGLNVNIVGGLPGLTTGYGPSHQATEDMAIFRGMPGPDDRRPVRLGGHRAGGARSSPSTPGPTYLRLLRGHVPTVLDEYDYTFELGKAKVVRRGTDVVFVSSGLMTMRALQAAEELAAHHVDVAVVHTPTIKPFDEETVLREIDTDRLARDAGEPHRRRRTVRDGGVGRGAPRARQADHARSRCPTSSSPRARCPPCTTATACRRVGSSPRSWTGCSIDVDSQVLTLEGRRMTVEPDLLLRLEKTSLREQALSALRKAITTGQIQPGTHLVETELSEALQISRGTLREAMRQLQQEGLISAGAQGQAVGAAPRHQGDPRHLRRPRGVGGLGRKRIGVATRPRRRRRRTPRSRRGHGALGGLQPRGPHRGRPALPPDDVPADGQRDAAALLVVAGGQHPDVDHVRRSRTGTSRTWTPNVTSRSSTRSSRATVLRRPTRCARTWPARRRCSSTARSNWAVPHLNALVRHRSRSRRPSSGSCAAWSARGGRLDELERAVVRLAALPAW